MLLTMNMIAMGMVPTVLVLITSPLLSSGSALSKAEHYVQVRQAEESCSLPIEDFLAANPQCANNSGLNSQDVHTVYRDFVCEPNCGSLYLSYIRTQCQGPQELGELLAEYNEIQCGVNADRIPCYTFYDSTSGDIDTSVVDPESALQVCPQNSSTCTTECRSQLTAIRSHFGCCVNSVFNSSYFHSRFYPGGSTRNFGTDFIPAFSNELWTTCGVQTFNGPCTTEGGTVTPASDGALTKVTMVLTVICVVPTILFY